MSMRIVRAQAPAGQADEMARTWEAFSPERLRAQPGFRHAHVDIDRATGATATVTVVDERPDDVLVARLLGEFRDMVGTSGSGEAPEVTRDAVGAEG